MTCPLCLQPVALPPPHEPAVCEPCDVRFQPVADMGWFDYSVTVYALEP